MEIVNTGDGSKTFFNAQIGENYHSKHGAVAESKHVFIQKGLHDKLLENPELSEISVLEIGFGTGLNFLMSLEFIQNREIHLKYSSVEAYPLELEKIQLLEFQDFVPKKVWDAFLGVYNESLNTRSWKRAIENAEIKLYAEKVLNCDWEDDYDVIYFDAFAAIHQPEMWTSEVLGHVCKRLKKGGFFVTYAITGELKRTMKSLGFQIEKLPGAPGKREMLRAIKI